MHRKDGTHVAPGDLLWSKLHGRYVRYLRTEPLGLIVVADRNTGIELPDYVHPSQLRVA